MIHGEHQGLTPLGAEARTRAAALMLRLLGRLGAGKSVALRQAVIKRTIEGIADDERYWPEKLAAGLTGDGAIESIPAHLVVFAVAWDLAEGEVAKIMSAVNNLDMNLLMERDRIIQQVLAAAPEFRRRFEARKINSDEIFLRVAMVHLFRRDWHSIPQLFVIDGVVRTIGKVLKHDVVSLTRSILERFEDGDVPEQTWGYIVLLMELSGRSGFFVLPPDEYARNWVRETRGKLEAFSGELSDEAFMHQAMAAFYSMLVDRGSVIGFSRLAGAVLEMMGIRCAVVYVSTDEGGFHTIIEEMPTQDAKAARRMAAEIPAVRSHDDFRRLAEFLRQKGDTDRNYWAEEDAGLPSSASESGDLRSG